MTTSSLPTPANNKIVNIAIASDKYKKGGRASLLWNKIPGSPPPLRVTPLMEALETEYATDAHFVAYVVRRDGKPVYYQPRLLKEELPLVREHGFEVLFDLNVADIDTIGHQPITPAQVADARAKLAKVPSIGWYTSKAGLRILQPRLTPCGPEEYEVGLTSWLVELQELLGPDWVVDMACGDWTRMFRLPRVLRDREETKPIVETATMEAIEFPRFEVEPAAPFSQVLPIIALTDAPLDRQERAKRYVACITPPPCGSSSCHRSLWNVALHVVKGFDVGHGAALSIVSGWAGRSQHEWKPKEIERKVRDAAKANVARGFHLYDDNQEQEPTLEDGPGIAIEEHEVAPATVALRKASPPAMVSKEATGTWKDHLLVRRGKDGKKTPKSCAANVEAFLRHHPDWRGRIGLDTFNQALVWLDAPPTSWLARYPESSDIKRSTPWTEADTTRLIAALNRESIEPGRDVVRNVAQAVADAARIHPVREYLCGLKHDGQKRIERWLTTYLGAEDTEHNRKAGMWWLIQAVRRIFEPGASAKYVLTLEGAQDIGKSTALRILTGSEWFSDTEQEIGTLNGMLALQGVWIQEIAEGALLSKASRQGLKAWISKPSDHYPPKFSNMSVTVLRQIVFAMTTNDGRYLSDPTGAVRFWPVHVTKVHFDALRADRDQLWAEAVAMYRAGVIPEPRTSEEKAMFAEEVVHRQQSDVWEEKIADYVDDKEQVTVAEILGDACLEVKTGQQTKHDQTRVIDALTALGWVQGKHRPVINGKRARVYLRIVAKAEVLPLNKNEEFMRDTLLAAGWIETVDSNTGCRSWHQPDAKKRDEVKHADEAAALLESV